jgi:hypothetical protein
MMSSSTDFCRMVDEQCIVIINIVWWMNMQMYDAFWYLLLMSGG